MRHTPVLLKEVIEGLNLRPNANTMDCTLGDGGHAEAILSATAPKGRLIGIDADPESLLRAKQYLYNFSDRAIFVRDNFSNLKKIIADSDFGPVDAVLMDLGWSTSQFMERGRGFSFDKDEPLDMRYTPTAGRTAADIVNAESVGELAKLFKLYGEEKLSGEIAAAITAARKNEPIQTARELSEVILQVYRDKLGTDKEIPWVGGIHPSTKVFQALRIAVNDELEVLKAALPQAVEAIVPGGRLAVISFHSLEDRIVKQYFQKVDNKLVKTITKKPIVAGERELAENQSAQSAKLRVVEKI